MLAPAQKAGASSFNKMYAIIDKTTKEEQMSNVPGAFNDLTAKELYRSAVEDFAIAVDEKEKANKKLLLAAFLESGIAWDDYVAQHPEVAPEPPTNVVTSADVTATPAGVQVEPVVEAEPEVVIRVAEAPKPNVLEKYLIKMVRENPVYEVKGQRFTSKHPYALVDERMADYLLTKEDGFRQATPGELREFYG